MSHATTKHACPRCKRIVAVNENRYVMHHDPSTERGCPLSMMRVPFASTQQQPRHQEGRAHLVAELAAGVQDEDPSAVWAYLTALPHDELARLALFALAGIPLDQTVDEMFAWVANLPAAKIATAQEKTAA